MLWAKCMRVCVCVCVCVCVVEKMRETLSTGLGQSTQQIVYLYKRTCLGFSKYKKIIFR